MAGSVTMRAQARRLRARAVSLRRDAERQRRRNAELCERLAELLLEAAGRPFGGRGERFTLRLGRLSPMLRFARHDLRGWLQAARLPKEVVDDVALAFSEACANAIEHPKQPRRHLVEIEGWHSDTEIELRIRDYGSWTDRRSSAQRGRGLSMIGRLMDSLDVEQRLDGTEIVMRRSVAPADIRAVARAR